MSNIPEYNFPAFHAAEEALVGLGHQVENPAVNGAGGTDKPYDWYVRRGLVQLTLCDGVALLPGWENSTGARLEVHAGAVIGCQIRSLAEWLALGVADRQ